MKKILISSILLFPLLLSDGFALNFDVLPYRVKVYGEKDDIYCHIDDPIENIACLAHDAAIGVKKYFSLNDTEAKALMAIELANIIQRIASSPRNNFYIKTLNEKFINTKNSKHCLLNYYGICGNHQEIFAKAMMFLGIRTRYLSVYYMDESGNRHNHAAAEFLLNGKWRFIDVTWAAFWLGDAKDISSLLGFEEVIEKKSFPDNVNSSDIWFYYSNKNVPDVFSYLSAKKYYLIQYGASGTVEIEMTKPVEIFTHIPNYIGANDIDAEMKLRISIPEGREGIYNFKISGASCKNEAEIILKLEKKRYPLKVGNNFISLKDEQLLAIDHKPSNICYVVLDKIELKLLSTN